MFWGYMYSCRVQTNSLSLLNNCYFTDQGQLIIKFVIMTALYKPIKLVKLKFVFIPELYYMSDGLTF